MADQSDVETALATLIGSILYPQGTDAASIVGKTCRIYRGWPNAAALDADLAAGRLNVTIFPAPAPQQNTTRWPDEIVVTTRVTPTVTIDTAATTATIGGTVSAGQLAGLLVDSLAVVRRTQSDDTPELIAAALAALLRQAGRIVQLSGATMTIPGAGLIVGRVVADQPTQQTTRRQCQGFRITVWCPDPASRDAAASAIDAALSSHSFIALADGTSGRLRFVSFTVFDQSQDAALYRRDLLYSVEYATTVTATLPSMLFGDARFAANGAIAQSLLG
jgi:hypothetical protein